MSDSAIGDDAGTQSPIQIETWEDLANITSDMEGEYVLANDLNENTSDYDEYASENANGGDGWDPIGTLSWSFDGRLDGAGHTISDLFVSRTGTGDNGIGLFASLTGTIENLTVEALSVTGNNQIGVLVGMSQGTITNCAVSGDVYGEDQYQASMTGGIVGDNRGLIADSYATGNVTGHITVGGIAGKNTLSGQITRSYATGHVQGIMSFLGGLVGENNGVIEESYATGDVDGVNTGWTITGVGGLVGKNTDDGIVENSYATGSATIPGSENVGALVGENDQNAEISRSYSAGTASGPFANEGGVTGLNQASAVDVYYNSDLNDSAHGENDSDSDTTTGLSTDEMQGTAAESNMSALDFQNTWKTVDDDYPTLLMGEGDSSDENVTVSTQAATNVGETSATLNGDVTELENASSADVSFQYGETGAGLPNTVDAGDVSSTGTFEETADSLEPATEYEFQAVAETSDDEDDGDVLTFTTEAAPLSVSAEDETIAVGGEATISIDATSVEKITVASLWTDWMVSDETSDGGTFIDKVGSEGACEFEWDTLQGSVSPAISVSPPSRYVGGEFLLDIDATDGDSAEGTTVILKIDSDE